MLFRSLAVAGLAITGLAGSLLAAISGRAGSLLAISGLAVAGLSGGLLAVARLAISGLAEGGLPIGRRAWLAGLAWWRVSGLAVARLPAARRGVTALTVTALTVTALGVAALTGSRGRLLCPRDCAARGGRVGATEAQACQAVPSLVRPRLGLLVETVSREVRPGLVRPGLVRTGLVRPGQVLAGWVRPGGVLRLGAGPLISRGRDYPGALRLGGVILFSQAAHSVRLLTGGPVRLVTGRDG